MFRLFYVLMTFFVVHVILFRVDGMSGKDIVGVTSFILLPATASVNPPSTLEALKQGFRMADHLLQSYGTAACRTRKRRTARTAA